MAGRKAETDKAARERPARSEKRRSMSVQSRSKSDQGFQRCSIVPSPPFTIIHLHRLEQRRQFPNHTLCRAITTMTWLWEESRVTKKLFDCLGEALSTLLSPPVNPAIRRPPRGLHLAG